jgi:peptidyl-prolyl cis-trans isomerase SurA
MPSLRLSTLLAAILLAAIGCGAPARAQTIVVMVNGEPITNMDIEQRSKLTFMTTHKQPTRQEVIDELIDEKVKIKASTRRRATSTRPTPGWRSACA